MRGSNDTTHGSASKRPQVSSESDKPPPYSRAPTLPLVDRYNDPNFPKRSLRQRRSREDALETLKKYDTVLVVDDSASMQGPRWEEVGALIRRHVLRTKQLTLHVVSGKEGTF